MVFKLEISALTDQGVSILKNATKSSISTPNGYKIFQLRKMARRKGYVLTMSLRHHNPKSSVEEKTIVCSSMRS